MRKQPDFTDPSDPEVVKEALTRQCSMCQMPKGVGCVCIVHSPPHPLASCYIATGRIVHYSRTQAPPRGEK